MGRPTKCVLCKKERGDNGHRHGINTIPPKERDMLLKIYRVKKYPKTAFVCCDHFKPHDLVFQFTPGNFPGLNIIEVCTTLCFPLVFFFHLLVGFRELRGVLKKEATRPTFCELKKKDFASASSRSRERARSTQKGE